MNFWVGLIIGLILGWVIEWVIDWLFWRREEDTAPVAAAASRTAEFDLQGKVAALEAEKVSLAARLQDALNREPQVVVQEVVREVVKEVLVERDRLQKIHGIGDVFTRRFNEAGVYSFAQLAALTPEQARDIIKPEEWQAIEPEVWIAEARQFAGLAANSQGEE